MIFTIFIFCCFSLSNSSEADLIVEYIKVLLRTKKCRQQVRESDIGVVTPYKNQAHVIQEKLFASGLGEITVGTAAVLQGKEKQIIIISTVSVGIVSEFAANFRVIFYDFCAFDYNNIQNGFRMLHHKLIVTNN